VSNWIAGDKNVHTGSVRNVHNTVHVQGHHNDLCVAGGDVQVPVSKGQDSDGVKVEFDCPEFDEITATEVTTSLGPSEIPTSPATSAFRTAPSSPAHQSSLEERVAALEEASRFRMSTREMDLRSSTLTPRERWLEQRVLSLEKTLSILVEEVCVLRNRFENAER